MAKTDDFPKLVKEIYEELNRARTDPATVAADLLKAKNFYKNKEYKNPALGFTFETQEGVKAVEDAIEFLKKKVYPQKPLAHSDKLDRAAQSLLQHYDQTGGTSPSQEEFGLQKRLSKELGTVKSMAESSSFGFNNPREIIYQLIIDDGVSSRANRKNLYSPNFQEVGLAVGRHKDYGYCCIIDFHGDGKKEEKQMEKYQLPKSEWPPGAVNLATKMEMRSDGHKKTTTATYTFTLSDGKTEVKVKEFVEEI